MRYVEDEHQAQLVRWSKLLRVPNSPIDGATVWDFLFAIPNGGFRNVREAARLKAQGVKAGVSDLFLAFPSGRYSGLWIEMKKPKGKNSHPRPTKAQEAWINRMSLVGYKAKVCYGFDEARDLIESYLRQIEG